VKPEPQATGARSVDPRTACLLVAAVAAVGAAFAAGGEPRSRADALVAPELPVADARCEVAAHEAARRARDAALGADAHMARYPFAPGEGLRALALLAEARDCLALAAAPPADAAELARRTARYRARVGADYRERVTRVRRALAQARLELARDDVPYLLELLAGQQSAFVAELRGLQLDLDAAGAHQEAP